MSKGIHILPSGNIGAVYLRNNTSPTAGDQITDIGNTEEKLVKAANLYTQTSYYQNVDIIELQIVWYLPVKG